MRFTCALAVLVLAAACGGGDSTSGGSGGGGAGSGASQSDQLVACDDLVGRPARDLANGCAGPDGSIQAVLTYTCNGGVDFYAAGTDQRMWWARKDGQVQAGTQAEYNAAQQQCIEGTR